MAGPTNSTEVDRFLMTKATMLRARARRLNTLTPRRVGLRRQDIPYAPSRAHFDAANKRLKQIDGEIIRRQRFLERNWEAADSRRRLVYMAMLEREVDRVRRTFGMFFEMFSQRGSDFAAALAAHDMIAADCYQAVRDADSLLLDRPLLKPLTYMEHGYSPATMRRGVTLVRLLGETNPFPVIRIPWDRDSPWQSVFLHEVAHNLQADLQIWQENQDAVSNRMLRMGADPLTATIYRRWHKEIFADLAAVLLGGTASAWGMLDFLAHPDARALTYRPGGAHPTGYIRGLIMVEMVRRLGLNREADKIRRTWLSLYDPGRGHRLPPQLLGSADRVIPAVVDEIAFQTRRNLAQRALADVLPFTGDDEAAIQRGGMQLARGQIPKLPPRFIVSAARIAIRIGADPGKLSSIVTAHLAHMAAERRSEPLVVAKRAAA